MSVNKVLLAIVCMGSFAIMVFISKFFAWRSRQLPCIDSNKQEAINNSDATASDLLVAINTVPRPRHQDYLMQTLGSIKVQLTRSKAIPQTHVLVFHPSHKGRVHNVFNEAKKQFLYDENFTFASTPAIMASSTTYPGIYRTTNPKDIQLSNDFLALLQYIMNNGGLCKKFVLLNEDDFQWCPRAASHLFLVLKQFETKEFAAIRVSFGFSGLILQCKDLQVIHDYMKHNITLGPHDVIIEDMLKGFKNQIYYTYRYNLMQHIGISSTKGGQYSTANLECGDLILTIANQEHELYNTASCKGEFSYAGCNQYDEMGLVEAWQHSHLTQQITDPLPLKDSIVAGSYGLNCDEVCQERNKTCVSQIFPLINNCDLLKQVYKGCKGGCDHLDFNTKTTVWSPHYDVSSNTCWYTAMMKHINCQDKGDKISRSCCTSKFVCE